MKKAGRGSRRGSTDRSLPPAFDPLSSALEGTDPLSMMAAEATDPLSQMVAQMAVNESVSPFHGDHSRTQPLITLKPNNKHNVLKAEVAHL